MALPILRTADDHANLVQTILAGVAQGQAQALASQGIISFLGVNPATGLAEIEVHAMQLLEANALYEQQIQGAQVVSTYETREQGAQTDSVSETQSQAPNTEQTTVTTGPTKTRQADGGETKQLSEMGSGDSGNLNLDLWPTGY